MLAIGKEDDINESTMIKLSAKRTINKKKKRLTKKNTKKKKNEEERGERRKS